MLCKSKEALARDLNPAFERALLDFWFDLRGIHDSEQRRGRNTCRYRTGESCTIEKSPVQGKLPYKALCADVMRRTRDPYFISAHSRLTVQVI